MRRQNNALIWILIVGEEIERRTTSSIGAARQKIGKEISELNEKLKVCKEAIQQMKAEIAKLEQQDQEPKDIASLIPNVVPWVRSLDPGSDHWYLLAWNMQITRVVSDSTGNQSAWFKKIFCQCIRWRTKTTERLSNSQGRFLERFGISKSCIGTAGFNQTSCIAQVRACVWVRAFAFLLYGLFSKALGSTHLRSWMAKVWCTFSDQNPLVAGSSCYVEKIGRLLGYW